MIAAKMREPNERAYFADQVKPLLGDDVELIGEITNGDKVALLGGATALLNPIRWSEPFGLVMTEALACGTQ
jgi:glycosyltransferase involved in cell wall biosynthesis